MRPRTVYPRKSAILGLQIRTTAENQLEESRGDHPALGVQAQPCRGRNAGGGGVGGAAPRRGQCGEAAGSTCMESARSTLVVQDPKEGRLCFNRKSTRAPRLDAKAQGLV